MAKINSRSYELLTDLEEHIAAVLAEGEIGRDKATQFASAIVERMCSHWGGQNIYFPMGLSFKLARRDEQIRAEFDGHNHAELARKYQRSVQWIYHILARTRHCACLPPGQALARHSQTAP